MKYLKMAKWMAALGCLCFEGLMPKASALCLTLDQVTVFRELDASRASENQQTQDDARLPRANPNGGFMLVGQSGAGSGQYFNFRPWTEFISKHNRSKMILDSAGDHLLVSDDPASTVVWVDSSATYQGDFYPGQHKEKPKPGHSPPSQDVGNGDSKPYQVPDAGSTLVLLGLALGSLGLFQPKLRKAQA
jgi:hypothetical protein